MRQNNTYKVGFCSRIVHVRNVLNIHLNTNYVVCQASYELHVCTLFACALQLCLGKPALNIMIQEKFL